MDDKGTQDVYLSALGYATLAPRGVNDTGWASSLATAIAFGSDPSVPVIPGHTVTTESVVTLQEIPIGPATASEHALPGSTDAPAPDTTSEDTPDLLSTLLGSDHCPIWLNESNNRMVLDGFFPNADHLHQEQLHDPILFLISRYVEETDTEKRQQMLDELPHFMRMKVFEKDND